MEEKKVRWLCRRGMKELDVMLERYLERRWPEADAGERAAFVELLEMQDPDLWRLLGSDDSRRIGGAPTCLDVIARIRALSGL